MGSLRVGHDWATSLSLFTFMHWRKKWQPTPVFLPGESQGWGAWWTAIYGVAQSWTWLKRLSSSSSSSSWAFGLEAVLGFPGVWRSFSPLCIVCCAELLQLCLTLWGACQAPLSSGILQPRILEWVAISYSRGSSQPRDWTCLSYVSRIDRWALNHLHHLGSPVSALVSGLSLFGSQCLMKLHVRKLI